MKQLKRIIISIVLSILSIVVYSQTDDPKLRMITEYTSNEELLDILHFEKIDYFKIRFIGGEAMKNKSYCIKAKELKDGVLVSDSVIFDSKETLFKMLEMVNDTILKFSVIAKRTPENKLKIMFNFPAFSTGREFNVIETKDKHVLKNIAEDSNLPINYAESFYLLAYILPYDQGNGIKSYCEVSRNGEDIENWGTKFGIKHYILFEMKIE